MKRVLARSVVGLAVLGLIPGSALGDGVGESVWDSTLGPLHLQVGADGRVSGTVPQHQGTLKGRISPEGDLEVLWFQAASAKPCSRQREGSVNWGRVVWQPSPDGTRLKGRWAYCDEPLGGAWDAQHHSGVRLVAVRAEGGGAGGGRAVERETLDQRIREQWGQGVNPRQVFVRAADVTCDGVNDQVAARVNLDSPEGPTLDLMVVSDPGDGVVAGELSLPYGGDLAYGICGAPEEGVPPIQVERVTPGEAREMAGRPACHQVIAIRHECDAVFLLWLARPEGDARFALYQNAN